MKKWIIIIAMLLLNGSDISAQAFYRLESKNEARLIPSILYVYPNPVANNLNIVLNYIPERTVSMNIYDFNGTYISSFKFAPGVSHFNLQVNYLRNGQYILQVHEDTRWIGNVRFIKSNVEY